MERTPNIEKPKKSKSQRRRRFKLEKKKIPPTSFQKDYTPQENLTSSKPYFLMEKVTTNREIVQITQIDPQNPPPNPQNPIRELTSDLLDLRPPTTTHSNTNTPLVQNYPIPDTTNNMKELKLFSRVESYGQPDTVYFSNKILQRNFDDSKMPALPNSYLSENGKEGKRKKQVGIFTTGGRVKSSNNSQPRMKNAFNSDSKVDTLNRRMKRVDLSSWGGVDYNNHENCAPEGQYNTVSKSRRGQITKNSKFNTGNVKIKPIKNKMKLINTNEINIFLDKGRKEGCDLNGAIKPLFNDEMLGEEERKIHSPESRGYRNQLESDHSFSNPVHTQTKYFQKKDDISLQKVAKSNSYSPSKKKLNKINKKIGKKNKDDPFFYERSSTMIADSENPKDLSLSMIPSKKGKKGDHLIPEHNEGVHNSMMKPSQFRKRVNTGNTNSSGQGTYNYRSKVKKRLKFTMRTNKMVSSKVQNKKKKHCDLNFKVQGLSGFLNTSNEVYNEQRIPDETLDDVSAKIVITKPQNGTRNNKNTTIQSFYRKEKGNTDVLRQSRVKYAPPCYNNEVFYTNSNNTTNEMKSDSDTFNNSNSNTYAVDDSYSPEKRLVEARYLQPPHMQKSALSKTASELPGMGDSKRINISSQKSNSSIRDKSVVNSCFSESSSRMKSQHKMKRNRCTIITECEGPRTCYTTQTKRLCMKRRAEMSAKPVLIINFHGVLGCLRKSHSNIDDLCKARKYYQQTQEEDVFIRQAASKNLKSLMGTFQIVLFINKYAKKHDAFINIVEGRVGDVFDAIYTRCSYKNDNKIIDYSQVYQDFGISTEDIDDRVAVLCPINMETEEVRDREREELLFIDNSQNYSFKNIVAECIPMNSNAYKNPLSILFASIKNDVFENEGGLALNKGGNRMMTFARLTKFLSIIMNAFEEEASKSSTKSSNSDKDDFSFTKGFKALQKLITKSNITTLKSALFSTNKISQAVNRQKQKEDSVLKFRSEKKNTYKSQLEREEIHKKFIEYNFHLAKTNPYINLKSQNVHTSRHVNQYYNEYYYEQIEQEEEDMGDKQNIPNQLDNLLVQFQNFKIPDISMMSTSSTRLYLNRFVALDHVVF